MPLIRDMRELHPAAIGVFSEWLRRCASKGYPVLVIETRRDARVMEAYYARGREHITKVNALYYAAGLNPISEEDNKKTITNAHPFESWHAYGLAVDTVPLVAGRPDWVYSPNESSDVYDEIALIARHLGIVWGDTFNDYCHFEYHPGYHSVHEAMANYQLTGDWKVPVPGPHST